MTVLAALGEVWPDRLQLGGRACVQRAGTGGVISTLLQGHVPPQKRFLLGAARRSIGVSLVRYAGGEQLLWG